MFGWFSRTDKTYTPEQMQADHEATMRAVFGNLYNPVPTQQQRDEAEAAAESAGIEDDD